MNLRRKNTSGDESGPSTVSEPPPSPQQANGGSGSLMNLRRKNTSGDESGPSTVSEPPPSPQQAYFDKYPKRAERIRERKTSDKHVTIEFPTIQERRPSLRQGGLRDWRVVQAHLEPKTAPRSSKRKGEKIRDPDDMVIVSLADDHDRTPPANSNSFRSSVISSAGTLTSEPGALTPPRTPTSPHEPLIASSSVEAMDALIDSMAMGSTASLDSMPFLTPSYPRSSRFAYPLYQPPLPTPPDGVKLGIVEDADTMGWKPKGKRADKSPGRVKAPEPWREDLDDTETEAEYSRRTPASSSSSVTPSRATTPSTSRTGTPAPSLAPTTRSAPIRIRSDEEIEADERADVTSPLVPPLRTRQRSGVSARSVPSARSAPSVRSGRTISTGSTSSSVHKARTMTRSPGMWDIPNSADETESYSVLAHSAGAPYALAGSLKAGERVMGSVHLLAPWVSMAVDGGYKWLKYVPNGLIKTAQAAEWRLQGWMLGKPPTIQYEGIGFDANAPMSPGRVSFSSFSEYDELDDFDGRFASRSVLVLDKQDKGQDKPGQDKGQDKSGQDKVGQDKPASIKPKEKQKEPVSDLDARPRKGSKSTGEYQAQGKTERTRVGPGRASAQRLQVHFRRPVYEYRSKGKILVEVGGRESEAVGGKSELEMIRSREVCHGSDIFGGLFTNTVPKGTPKRGVSTPPSAYVGRKIPVEVEGGRECEAVGGKSELEMIRSRECETIRGECETTRGKEFETRGKPELEDDPLEEPESPANPPTPSPMCAVYIKPNGVPVVILCENQDCQMKKS
ncbi:hypothetical protein RSAG8_08058, partial [Rhizoctonia solani AG-8 WAC10335]